MSLKTAKEVCEDLRIKTLKKIIEIVENNGGSSVFDDHFIKPWEEELVKLGYKVSYYKEPYYDVITVREKIGEHPETTFLGFFIIPAKPIYEAVTKKVLVREYPVAEVTACCGEEK